MEYRVCTEEATGQFIVMLGSTHIVQTYIFPGDYYLIVDDVIEVLEDVVELTVPVKA